MTNKERQIILEELETRKTVMNHYYEKYEQDQTTERLKDYEEASHCLSAIRDLAESLGIR